MKIEEILVDLKEFSEEGHTEYGYEMPLSEVRVVIRALETIKAIEEYTNDLPKEIDEDYDLDSYYYGKWAVKNRIKEIIGEVE